MNRLSAGCEAGRNSWIKSKVFLSSVSNTGDERGTIFRQAYWHLVFVLLQWFANISNSAVSSASLLLRRVQGVTQSSSDGLCRTAQHANSAYIICKPTAGLSCLQRQLSVAAKPVGPLASSDAAPQASETTITTTTASDLLECKSAPRKTFSFSSWRVVPVNFPSTPLGKLHNTIQPVPTGASHGLIHGQHEIARSILSCFATRPFVLSSLMLDNGAQHTVTDSYLPVERLRSMQFKISGREPEDLPTHFTEWLCALAGACGCLLSAVYIRKGCIELTLDIENAGMVPERQEGEEGQLEGRTLRLNAAASAVPTLPSAAATYGASGDGTTGSRETAATNSPKATQGQQHQQPKQQQRGVIRIGSGNENRFDLGGTEGAMALAQRLHDALGGGVGSGGMTEVRSRAAPVRRPSDGRDVNGASNLATGVAVPSLPQQQQQPASVVRTVAFWQSSFVPPLSYPAISRVRPRVIVVQAGRQVPAHRHGVSSTPGWDRGAAGVGAASVGAPMATLHHAGMAAVAAASHERRRESPRPITLLVEISAPPDVRLAVLGGAVGTPAMASHPVSASTDSIGASPAMPASVASIPIDTPDIELLVRCSGRYIPIDISLAPSQGGVATGDCDGEASAPDAEYISGGGGGIGSTVMRSYRITLLESPIVTGGVMLLDLRWQGRPAQVVPVVLLDEQDEQLQMELAAVAATWTGPPHELDGLLYDVGVWLRCMALRRAARTATQAMLGVGRSSTQAQTRGPGPAMSAAVASGRGCSPAARGEPPFLPVLGASLLQFAHAHGLIGMARRLQVDMRDCGYTAPFRITSMHHVAAAVEAEAAAGTVAGDGHSLSPPEATRQGPSALPELRCGMDAAARGRTTPTRPVVEVGIAPSPPSVTASGAVNRVLASESPSAVATLGSVDLHPMQRSASPAATVVTVGQWWFIWEVISLPPSVQRRRGSGPTLVEEESYLPTTFEEPLGAAVYCLFHLLDMLGLLELLIHLALTTHQQRGNSSIPAGAVVDTSHGGGGVGAATAALSHGTLMLLVVLTSLPVILNFSLQLLLPTTTMRRVAPHAKLVWHACLVARRVVLLWGGLPSIYPRSQQGYGLGPGVLVMEGVVVPAACLLSPWAALLLAALKLPLYVLAGHTSAIGKAADVAAAATTAEVCMSRGHCVATAPSRWHGDAGGGGALLVESVFRALVVTTMALLTTLACHVSLRMRTRKLGQVDAGKGVRRADGVQAEGKVVATAAVEGVAAARTVF
ncbi:hypothetical protein VaNZ11_014602 [Volvox africanus]|uniref:Uncharacterized protein n=1 Tax=Volvox africanus TaxID=51714 RepID=A0ABQ5SIU7_9CHLO|nr:hypothetical protein VaNZ11_014602 [Volvox africanus]